MTALEKELSELRERVADLQSDKVLIEEELKEALTGQDQQEEKSSAKVCVVFAVVYAHRCMRFDNEAVREIDMF